MFIHVMYMFVTLSVHVDDSELLHLKFSLLLRQQSKRKLEALALECQLNQLFSITKK